MKFSNIVVGAGFTGVTIAERLKSRGESVLVIEKRNHIGGNCYDFFDKDGCYIKLYGPHIFHTSNQRVWNYISQFTEWNNYRHQVFCFIGNKLIPIPFNLNSIDLSFGSEKSKLLTNKLINKYGENAKVSIYTLLNEHDQDLRDLANYVYEKVFLNYTIKQWGHKPDELDKSVLNRVPVIVNREDYYFTDKYQGIPLLGYTKVMEKMLDGIPVMLNTDYKSIINQIAYDKIYYTGPLDYYFDYIYGEIKYRCIELKFEKHDIEYQENSVINYPNDNEFTRITEFNKFMFIKSTKTIIAKEYASWNQGFVAYPLQNKENLEVINKYFKESGKDKKLVLAGRLAECKYYNMDQAILKGIEVTE